MVTPGGEEPEPQNAKWRGDYIARVLKNPALVGLGQPHKLDEKRMPVAEGAPIEDHYPRIISDKDFEAIRLAAQTIKVLNVDAIFFWDGLKDF